MEVLDRGEETPRSPAFSGRPADTEGQPLDGGGNTGHVGKPLPYSTSKIFQVNSCSTRATMGVAIFCEAILRLETRFGGQICLKVI